MGADILAMAKLEDRRLRRHVSEATVTVICRVALFAEDHTVLDAAEPMIP